MTQHPYIIDRFVSGVYSHFPLLPAESANVYRVGNTSDKQNVRNAQPGELTPNLSHFRIDHRGRIPPTPEFAVMFSVLLFISSLNLATVSSILGEKNQYSGDTETKRCRRDATVNNRRKARRLINGVKRDEPDFTVVSIIAVVADLYCRLSFRVQFVSVASLGLDHGRSSLAG